MEIKSAGIHTYILDGEDVVGCVGNLHQAIRYIKNAAQFRTQEAFEPQIQRISEFVDAVEDEIGYEFENKDDILRVMQRNWPEIYDICVNLRQRIILHVYASGLGWHMDLAFTAEHVVGRTTDLSEMSAFNRLCAQYGYCLEDYHRIFQAKINGANKKVMPVAFRDDRVILQLAGGQQRFSANAASVKALLDQMKRGE